MPPSPVVAANNNIQPIRVPQHIHVPSSSSSSSSSSLLSPNHTSTTSNNPHSNYDCYDIQSELLAILNATIHGAKYGVKIRFPHSLVMTFLFRYQSTTLKEKIRIIVKSTLEHSRNLASFAAVYKVRGVVCKGAFHQLCYS